MKIIALKNGIMDLKEDGFKQGTACVTHNVLFINWNPHWHALIDYLQVACNDTLWYSEEIKTL